MSHPKHARPDHQILDVIRHRWSPRAFDPDRAVARTDLMRLFEASRWAPSSRNEQPWRFVVADRHESPEAFAAFAGTLKGKNADWATAASAIVLVAVRTTLESDESENRSAMYDTGQAVGFLTLQATAMGLAVAIPAFIAYQLFNNGANERVQDLRCEADRIFVALGNL